MKKNKILVVDDDPVIRDSLLAALQTAGFDAFAEVDGVAGLAKAKDIEPDLIVTDVEMPLMDGMTLLKEIRRSSDWGKKVPVIVLTNFDTTEHTFQGVVEDAPSFYLLKTNITPDSVVEKVQESLNTSATPSA